MEIEWNGFLKNAVEAFPNEVCAFLFSRKPYSLEEKWFVFQVKNISDTPKNSWIPDRKEMLAIKSKAVKMRLVKIGNIHTHPYRGNDDIEDECKPSEMDLGFARKFNDIIRGIMVVDNKTIYGIKFNDKFGNEIPIVVEQFDNKEARHSSQA